MDVDVEMGSRRIVHRTPRYKIQDTRASGAIPSSFLPSSALNKFDDSSYTHTRLYYLNSKEKRNSAQPQYDRIH